MKYNNNLTIIYGISNEDYNKCHISDTINLEFEKLSQMIGKVGDKAWGEKNRK